MPSVGDCPFFDISDGFYATGTENHGKPDIPRQCFGWEWVAFHGNDLGGNGKAMFPGQQFGWCNGNNNCTGTGIYPSPREIPRKFLRGLPWFWPPSRSVAGGGYNASRRCISCRLVRFVRQNAADWSNTVGSFETVRPPTTNALAGSPREP